MAKQSIESMYDIMFNMKKGMEDLLENATELAAAAKSYGGEISRVLTDQLSRYYAPAVKKLIDDENTPGSIQGLIRFMDSVPLAYTRVEPTINDVAPVAQQNIQLAQPATSNPVDNLPQNMSFAKPEGETVQESLKEAKNKRITAGWVVKRHSTVGSALGEGVANLKDEIVCNCETEECANEKATALNATVKPFEKEAFGTEYIVKKVK